MTDREFPVLCLAEEPMTALAADLAQATRPPAVIYLHGDLGAGKTTFARSFIRALGHQGSVKSPTYGLLEHYPLGGISVLHLDLYRIEDSGELEFLGLDDLIDGSTVLLVEWPDRGQGFLPRADLHLHFAHQGAYRTLRVIPATHSGADPDAISKLLDNFSS